MFGHQFNQSYYVNMGLLHPQFQRGSIENLFSLDPTAWDLGAVSHTLTRGFDATFQDVLMSKFIGDPVVGRLLSRVPSSVSYYVSKSLGGLGLKMTRPGLLTTEQYGFYCRVALTRGELAPSFDSQTVGPYAKLASFWKLRHVEKTAEYWDLDQVESPPMNPREAWSIYSSSSCKTINETVPAVNEALSREKNTKGWQGTLPISSDAFYAIRGTPYSEKNLCEFPWSKRAIEVADSFDHVALLSVEALRDRPLADDLWYKGVLEDLENDRVDEERLFLGCLFD